MAMANIVIAGANIQPNPVETNKQFIISVDIQDRVYVLGEDNSVIADDNGSLIKATE